MVRRDELRCGKLGYIYGVLQRNEVREGEMWCDAVQYGTIIQLNYITLLNLDLPSSVL